MWGLLVAAAIGIFSSIFGIGAPSYQIQNDAKDAPRADEITNSWWEDSQQQVNEESHGAPTNPDEYFQEIGKRAEQAAAAEAAAAEYEETSTELTDIRAAVQKSDGAKEGDSLTVLQN